MSISIFTPACSCFLDDLRHVCCTALHTALSAAVRMCWADSLSLPDSAHQVT